MIFSAGDVLDMLDKELQDKSEDAGSSSSDDSVDNDDRHCDFVDEEGSQRLVDANYLLPVCMSMFINSLGDLYPAERDSMLLDDLDLNSDESDASR